MSIPTTPAGSARRSGGAAIVEFALMLPILLVVLVGVIDFGFMVYDKAMVTNAAREAARAGIVLRNPRLTKVEVEAVATNFCQNKMISLGASNACTVTAVVPGEIKSQAVVPFNASATELDKTLLKVSVEYTYHGPIESVIGVLGVLGIAASLDLGTMRSTAVMKYE